MEREENKSHSILKQNKDGSLNPNLNILIVIIIIESEIK